MVGNTPLAEGAADPGSTLEELRAAAPEPETPSVRRTIYRGTGRGNIRASSQQSRGTGRRTNVTINPVPYVLGTDKPTAITEKPVNAPKKIDHPKTIGPLEKAAETLFRKTLAELQAKEKVARTVAAKLDEAAKEFRGREREIFDQLKGGFQRAVEEMLGGGAARDPQPVRPQQASPTPPTSTGPRVSEKGIQGVQEKPRLISEVAKEGTPTTASKVAAPKEKAKADHRIFIRVQGAMAENAPAAVRQKINQWAPDTVKDVRRVPTGFAVTARNPKANQEIMAKKDKLETVFGEKVEKATT